MNLPGNPIQEADFLMGKYKCQESALEYARFILHQVVEKDTTKQYWVLVIFEINKRKS